MNSSYYPGLHTSRECVPRILGTRSTTLLRTSHSVLPEANCQSRLCIYDHAHIQSRLDTHPLKKNIILWIEIDLTVNGGIASRLHHSNDSRSCLGGAQPISQFDRNSRAMGQSLGRFHNSAHLRYFEGMHSEIVRVHRVESGTVYRDSGMYKSNAHSYSRWRTSNAFWDPLVGEVY